MRNQRNITPPKEYSNFPFTDPKEMETYELPNKESKLIVLMKPVSYKRTQIYN